MGSTFDRHHPPTQPQGFFAQSDPFAGISQSRNEAEDDADSIDFEDTYDGLGDQLDEADDDLNDDTFGDGGAGHKPPGRDFDFFGATNKVSNAIDEEAVRFQRQSITRPQPHGFDQPTRAKPFKSGYEAYKKPGYMHDLQVDPSLWGAGPTTVPQAGPSQVPGYEEKPKPPVQKKMMSLEEVEAAMHAQPKQENARFSGLGRGSDSHSTPSDPFQKEHPAIHHDGNTYPPQGLPMYQHYEPSKGQGMQASVDAAHRHHIDMSPMDQRSVHQQPGRHQGLHDRRHQPHQSDVSGAPSLADTQAQPQPRQILQNPKRHSGQFSQPTIDTSLEAKQGSSNVKAPPRNEPALALPIITHPSQLANLSEEQRQAFMAEEAKRAKRNHKIYLLSKGNGLMTPQDKNFITRIQLQQLMTATGNVHDQDPSTSLNEDFYYQVYNQIESRPRQNPNQPLSNFAQTYLFQTGRRHGNVHRRHNRGDNHMHRMQQQVQRAVEAAKAKPKNKQLVIEGSLGKISFSNAKTPRPLLNIKRNERLPQVTIDVTERKAILKNIEAVYASLMAMEDHDRNVPQEPYNDDDPASGEPFARWTQKSKALNQQLWLDLKVLEPIVPESTVMHPFIAFLSYPKGKKAIPRIFSHIDQEQRLTILTIIMVQLDTLDVIRPPHHQPADTRPTPAQREQIDLFLQTVMPSLFSYLTEAPLSVIIGLVGLIIDRVNIAIVIRSRVGLEILTMLLSQAEIIHKAEATNKQEWEQWLGIYNRLFDVVEPLLASIFPASVAAGQDIYVWQFLASMGTGANPEQQQRLVLAVKDRVMDTIQHCKVLPPDMATQRRSDVNLFMQAIGLDVDLLDN